MATHVPEAVALGAVELPGAMNYAHDIDDKLSSGAAATKAYMFDTLEKAKGINVLRQTADPLVTRPAYLMNVEKVVGNFDRDTVEGLAHARQALAAALTAAEGKLKATVGIVPTSDARELRDRLQALSPEQRQAALAEAFANGDKATLGAIVGQSKLMHGCNVEYIAAAFDEYQRKVAPAEYASVEAHKKYVGYLDRAGPSLMAFTTRAMKGTGGYAKKRETTVAVLKSYGIEFED